MFTMNQELQDDLIDEHTSVMGDPNQTVPTQGSVDTMNSNEKVNAEGSPITKVSYLQELLQAWDQPPNTVTVEKASSGTTFKNIAQSKGTKRAHSESSDEEEDNDDLVMMNKARWEKDRKINNLRGKKRTQDMNKEFIKLSKICSSQIIKLNIDGKGNKTKANILTTAVEVITKLENQIRLKESKRQNLKAANLKQNEGENDQLPKGPSVGIGLPNMTEPNSLFGQPNSLN